MNSFGLFYSQLGYVPMNFKYKGIVKVAYGNFMSSKFWNNHKKTIYKEIKANIKEFIMNNGIYTILKIEK